MRLSCSEVRNSLRLGDDVESLLDEADEFTLARKSAKEILGTRTANRHRWARRES